MYKTIFYIIKRERGTQSSLLATPSSIWSERGWFSDFCLFQMNSSLEMDTSTANYSIVHLDAPILPDMSDISNVTIIRTGNGSIIEDHMFLNTVAAQALSGIFVWSALLITCHQVSSWYFHISSLIGELKRKNHYIK